MNGKIIYLAYESPRCVDCGRDLPRDRKRRCYVCQPPRGFRCNQATDPKENQEYTLADRAAQADAYGMSYGLFMAYIENNWPLPKRRHPVWWPMGSSHWGEEG